jgi:hypothetical protein
MTEVETLQNIQNYLSSINITKTGDLQKTVMQWLRNVDTFPYVCKGQDKIIQRYAAAVIMKSLSPQVNLTSEDECNWDGFICNEQYQVVSFIQGKYLSHNYVPLELTSDLNLSKMLYRWKEASAS